MEHLTKLFKLVELARSQPQTGYVLSGIRTDELSNLAEHQYLVTFFAWQMARSANREGAKLDIEKVLEFALIHDLGEILGGDIASPYAKVNRKAYRAAKAFEEENQRFLAKYFGPDAKHFRDLIKEVMDAKTDEALYAKAADFVECTHYLSYMGQLSKRSIDLAKDKLESYIQKIKGPAAKSFLRKFLSEWMLDLPRGLALDVIVEKTK